MSPIKPKSADEALSTLEDIVANIPDAAVYRYTLFDDGTDAVEFISSGCVSIWEVEAAEIKENPEPLWDMIHEEDFPAMRASVLESAGELSPWFHEWRIVTRSGMVKHLSGRGRPHRVTNGVMWNSLILDITDQKTLVDSLAAEKLSAEFANRAKDNFMSNLSHEMRTPLNAIVGFAEFLLSQDNGLDADKRNEYLNYIASSARLLEGLISDLYDLAVIDQGSLKIANEPVDLGREYMKVLHLFKDKIDEKDLSITTDTKTCTHTVLGDKTKISQIIINALSNAVKFTPDGGRIQVYLGEAKGCVVFSIADSGPGIDMEKLKGMTTPLVREAIYRETEQGMGLGLYIMKRLVDLHEGSLSFKGAPSGGTLVTVRFPASRTGPVIR